MVLDNEEEAEIFKLDKYKVRQTARQLDMSLESKKLPRLGRDHGSYGGSMTYPKSMIHNKQRPLGYPWYMSD